MTVPHTRLFATPLCRYACTCLYAGAAVMRKAYLKIAQKIHPDKLGKKFDGATKAFQVWP